MNIRLNYSILVEFRMDEKIHTLVNNLYSSFMVGKKETNIIQRLSIRKYPTDRPKNDKTKTDLKFQGNIKNSFLDILTIL
jgi:hypothetical protein